IRCNRFKSRTEALLHEPETPRLSPHRQRMRAGIQRRPGPVLKPRTRTLADHQAKKDNKIAAFVSCKAKIVHISLPKRAGHFCLGGTSNLNNNEQYYLISVLHTPHIPTGKQ